MARAALAPIGRFTARTEAIAGDPDLVAADGRSTGDDELARLARSFNATLDALERSVEAQRHLVADASHELRTPIASLRANIQTLEDADRLPPDERARAARRHRRRARRADGAGRRRGRAGAGRASTEDALDDVRLDAGRRRPLVERARRRGGDVTSTSSSQPTLVRGEPDRISRAVSNLLDNARQVEPGRRRGRGGGSRDGTLTVRDHGPGFAEDDLPHVFERFYRGDSPPAACPGSGLGLAIVRQAAEAHGGSVEASNADGGGALMRVRFAST